jgi:hypothetical protein
MLWLYQILEMMFGFDNGSYWEANVVLRATVNDKDSARNVMRNGKPKH